jgi:hypothetical protein
MAAASCPSTASTVARAPRESSRPLRLGSSHHPPPPMASQSGDGGRQDVAATSIPITNPDDEPVDFAWLVEEHDPPREDPTTSAATSRQPQTFDHVRPSAQKEPPFTSTSKLPYTSGSCLLGVLFLVIYVFWSGALLPELVPHQATLWPQLVPHQGCG